jgi:hypothetical protein
MDTTDLGTDKGCRTGNCTPSDLVAWDQYMWHQLVVNSLPGGEGSIDILVGANPYATVTIHVFYMLDTDKANNPPKYEYKLSTQIY